MDMYAGFFGKKDHFLRLDCRVQEHEYFPFQSADFQIVLLNTGVKHALVASEYNTRRAECEAGLALLKKLEPEVRSLRDATLPMLEEHHRYFSETLYRRCRHVVAENGRVEAVCRALVRGNFERIGAHLYASHESLRRLYEVSCPELDFLVEAAAGHPAVLGARMMGGGFGGCTINLVRRNGLEGFLEKTARTYAGHFSKNLEHYCVMLQDGCSVIELDA
jgi:galactokinase